jgi:hypothetical protein
MNVHHAECSRPLGEDATAAAQRRFGSPLRYQEQVADSSAMV